ncbi:DUF5318 family protein [Amycolatopsis viridis]|uniref:DUF5318 domain-containing protein n=1 Tax=Amycolatopsis viridis TaxID=185678 RepID=A0ABX0SMF3_9PSEU|nr:DUF5318 family protein [Amycolatopsis viridis]NIH77724.1 hypothetical protein [Amycolatopsis viridis]
MQNQRQVVDYVLQRRALLADVRAGRVGTRDVCDADPYLLRAARFHGEPSEAPCPLCGKAGLTNVSWVFGEQLRHVSGSARTPTELARLAGSVGEFTVHVVEVCPACRWNHLVRSYVLGNGAPHGPSRRTAGQ